MPGAHHRPRGRLGRLIRDHAPAGAIEDARRDLKAATAQNYIERLVESAPPLTEAQRARLAVLLLDSRRDPDGPVAA